MFDRYDDYWGDKAKIDAIQIQDFADSNALVNALQAGQIQTMDNLPYNLINTVKSQGGQISRASPARGCPSPCASTRSRSPTSGCARPCG